ncbi:MAG: hypothetical protein L6R19_01930 [Alphaproteobacteria bacterium]|nr:hypothetical protein [Alphaproteobacteria bacterium]
MMRRIQARHPAHFHPGEKRTPIACRSLLPFAVRCPPRCDNEFVIARRRPGVRLEPGRRSEYAEKSTIAGRNGGTARMNIFRGTATNPVAAPFSYLDGQAARPHARLPGHINSCATRN